MVRHIKVFAQIFGKLIYALSVFAVPAVCLAQQSCAQIRPPDLRAVDKPIVIYDRYIEPIQSSLSIGKSIILPNDVAGKAKLLATLQQEYMSYGEAAAIDLIQTIRQLYSSASLDTLNTYVVLTALKAQKNDDVAKQLAKTAMCAGPSPQSPMSKFDISFYALNEKSCKRMRRLFAPATSPDEIRVNNVVNDKCLADGFGKNGARNQITFTYSKS